MLAQTVPSPTPACTGSVVIDNGWMTHCSLFNRAVSSWHRRWIACDFLNRKLLWPTGCIVPSGAFSANETHPYLVKETGITARMWLQSKMSVKTMIGMTKPSPPSISHFTLLSTVSPRYAVKSHWTLPSVLTAKDTSGYVSQCATRVLIVL